MVAIIEAAFGTQRQPIPSSSIAANSAVVRKPAQCNEFQNPGLQASPSDRARLAPNLAPVRGLLGFPDPGCRDRLAPAAEHPADRQSVVPVL